MRKAYAMVVCRAENEPEFFISKHWFLPNRQTLMLDKHHIKSKINVFKCGALNTTVQKCDNIWTTFWVVNQENGNVQRKKKKREGETWGEMVGVGE